MKLNLALVVTVLPFLVQASPVAVAEAQPAAGANPIALPEVNSNPLYKRDKVCWVSMEDGPVNCRKGAGTGYKLVRKINGSDRFGVRCKANDLNSK
jgi:hypothetical protein